MVHNWSTRAVPPARRRRVTRLGPLRLPIELAALAVTPGLLGAGPIPGVPDILPPPSDPPPSTSPSPSPQPQPAPTPGETDDRSYAAPESANPNAKEAFAYTGPTGRVLL